MINSMPYVWPRLPQPYFWYQKQVAVYKLGIWNQEVYHQCITLFPPKASVFGTNSFDW